MKRIAVVVALCCSTALAEPGPAFPRVHLIGDALFDVPSRQFGFEVGATYAVTSWFDTGLYVNFGSIIALMVVVDGHLPWSRHWVLRPFLQLRGAVQLTSLGFGGGAWAGAEIELGPGRIKLGPALFGFTPRAGFSPLAVAVMLGYEFDLLRPAPERPLSVDSVEKRVVVEQLAPKRRTGVKGRLSDLEGRALEGKVRVGTKEVVTGGVFEFDVLPGEVELLGSAPGFLVRSRKVKVLEGETVEIQVSLRRASSLRLVELTPTDILLAQPIQFESGSAALTTTAAVILDEVADILIRERRIAQLRVEGHTDEPGGAERNQELSEDRALAVVKYLIEQGVEATRLQAQGFGSTRPLAINKTEAGRALNRRILFRLIQQ